MSGFPVEEPFAGAHRYTPTKPGDDAARFRYGGARFQQR
jgi:hypothetical protein